MTREIKAIRNIVAFVIISFFLYFIPFIYFLFPGLRNNFLKLLNTTYFNKLDFADPTVLFPPNALVHFCNWEIFLYRHCSFLFPNKNAELHMVVCFSFFP